MSVLEITPELASDSIQGLLEILGLAQGESLANQIKKLYKETDQFAVQVVRFMVAVLWWASHMASAASDARGYGAQIQAALKKADANTLATWQEWLNVKYPADLRKLYGDLEGSITSVKKSIPRQHKVNLKPIETELAALEKWKKQTVTPELKQWLTFYATWKKTYVKPMHTLISWLRSPGVLADFIALPLVSVLPSKLRERAAARSAFGIESALVATWNDNPQVIYDSILQWLVST